MLDRIEIVKPTDIEKRSMEIITEELNGRTWPEPEFSIVKRCIHTSADFDYADNLCFSERAAMLGVEEDPVSLPVILINDGRVIQQNLRACGKDSAWLEEVLKQEGAVPKEIFLLSLDGQGRVSCVRKEGL